MSIFNKVKNEWFNRKNFEEEFGKFRESVERLMPEHTAKVVDITLRDDWAVVYYKITKKPEEN